ncbi:hypothetical protein DFH08DRAFT_881250 [Mycena albidolilacea]|uniref:F-box domain-containing protein n=1 Tax=Mycena albidolilacea TaxID=1033008 RepID=A0AAD7EKN7_9AGAR|nr:hypothetical protein DFH08DRAFT_881250 [Mycena albidolilacea]
MFSAMPPELTDRTIDFLWDRQPDLRACSLVCRQWLPSSRRHLFESTTVRPDARFLPFLSSVVTKYARTLDFRLWPPEMDPLGPEILHHMPMVLNLRNVVLGSLPPSPENFPVLSRVVKLSLQHTEFPSCAELVESLAKFPALRELELAWVTCVDVGHNVWPRFPSGLEYLSIQGFAQTPGILQWLSSDDYPRTRALALHIPNDAPDPALLSTVSKFLRCLDGHLQYLGLAMYPSPNLQSSLAVLDLGGLSNVQRLRIGHGIYFHPPTTHRTSGMCRTFRSVLTTALGLASNNQLAELIFDVEISPDMWSFSSDSFFKGLLRDHTVAQIPVVRLHVLRGSHSYDAAARHCRQFAVYMGERGYVGRNILYSADEGK